MTRFYRIKRRVEGTMHMLVLYNESGEFIANGGFTGLPYTTHLHIPGGVPVKSISLESDGTIVLNTGTIVTRIE